MSEEGGLQQEKEIRAVVKHPQLLGFHAILDSLFLGLHHGVWLFIQIQVFLLVQQAPLNHPLFLKDAYLYSVCLERPELCPSQSKHRSERKHLAYVLCIS